jgi:hypothetical protein
MKRIKLDAKTKFLAATVVVSAALAFLFLKALSIVVAGGLLFLQAAAALVICLILFVALWYKSRSIVWRNKK